MLRKILVHIGSRVLCSLSCVTLISCTQMTKHSNTLVFGTNTTIGIKVGQDANQTPSIEVGYNRQEAAFVPLLANTAEGENKELVPCPGIIDNAAVAPKINIADCHFRASHNGIDKDAYSTIASFGSDTGASSANGGQVKVAVAQYFATGIAAQHLVLTGGANIVQAGGDTAAKANAAAVATSAISDAKKAKASSEYDGGNSIALTILGGDRSAMINPTDSKFLLMETIMGSGCGTIEVDRLLTRNSEPLVASNQLSVGTYLDRIRESRPVCFDPLISK